MAVAAKPVTLITGASSGIGAALARIFVANGHEVALVARREAELTALAKSLSNGKSWAHVLPLDLASTDAGERVAAALAERGLEPEYVVNNAGFGLLGRAATLSQADQRAMINLNVGTLTDLSVRFVDSLASHHGGILNVASIASFLPGPGMAVYYATKAYVLSFSEGLHRELAPKGIRVTALCPGPVLTGFQGRAGVIKDHYPPGFVRTPDQVALEGYKGLMTGRRVVVPGLYNKMIPWLPRLFPRRMLAERVYSRLRTWDDV